MKIALIESQVSQAIPHLGMQLIAGDLKSHGYKFTTYRVNYSYLDQLVDLIIDKSYSIIITDSRVPPTFSRKLKEQNKNIIIISGGLGLIDLMFKAEIDYGVVYNERINLLHLLKYLINEDLSYNFDGIIYKNQRDYFDIGDYSFKTDFENILFPFTPYLKWEPIGYSDASINNLIQDAPAPILLDINCPLRTFSGKNTIDVSNLNLGYTPSVMSERLKNYLTEILIGRLKSGCSFCAYTKFHAIDAKMVCKYALMQMEYYLHEYQIDSFALQSEYPFPYLLRIINQVIQKNIPIARLNIRCRPDHFVKNEKVIRDAVTICHDNRFKLHIWEVGFENFSSYELEKYNKSLTPKINRDALRILENLQNDFKETFVNDRSSHGLILIGPFTRMDDFYTNLKTLDSLPANLLSISNIPNRRLVLSDRLLPIWQELALHGRVIEEKDMYDSYRINPAITEVLRIYEGILKKEKLYFPQDLLYYNERYELNKLHIKLLIAICEDCKENADYNYSPQKEDLISTIQSYIQKVKFEKYRELMIRLIKEMREGQSIDLLTVTDPVCLKFIDVDIPKIEELRFLKRKGKNYLLRKAQYYR